MKKYQILINNLEAIADYTKLFEGDIKALRMNHLFANKKIKELANKVPKKFDTESIKKFEKETGLTLKYYVFIDMYSYYEYDRQGIHPDNEKISLKKSDLESNHYDESVFHSVVDADILVIDRISNFKKDAC